MLLRLLKILHIISKDKYKFKKNYNLIKKSKLFDKKYYLSKNPVLASTDMGRAKWVEKMENELELDTAIYYEKKNFRFRNNC